MHWRRIDIMFLWHYASQDESGSHVALKRKNVTFTRHSGVVDGQLLGIVDFGRHRENQIYLPGDQRVSRQHGILKVFEAEHGPRFVFGCLSTNGVIIDDLVAYSQTHDYPSELPLRHGSIIHIPAVFNDSEKRWIIFVEVTISS